jgi:type III secretory pathway component EscS
MLGEKRTRRSPLRALLRALPLVLPLTLALALVALLAGCGDDATATCGDAVAAGSETCDGADLRGQSCEALGYGKGTLACKQGCGDFDLSGCGAPTSCGNNAIEGLEVCDGAELAGKTCDDLGFEPGALACAANCLDYDTSKCGPKKGCQPQCGAAVCGVDPVCGKSCGECKGGEECQAGACVKVCDLPPLNQDGALNFDLKVVNVSGTLTVNGKTMGDDTVLDNRPRGYLRFIDVKSGDVVSVGVGETGPASYQVALYAGTYDIWFRSLGDDDQDVLPRDAITQLAAAKEIVQGGALNLDLKVIEVSGTVTVNGKTMANDTVLDNRPRAYLRFIDSTTKDVVSVGLEETGPASYKVSLYAGSYDVWVRSLGADDQDVLPNDAITQLKAKQTLEQSGALNLDLKVITVSGTLTVNGKAMGDDTVLDNRPRGYLRFIDSVTADTTSVSLGETGAASYSALLYAGTYDVQLYSLGEDDQDVLPRAATTELLAQKSLMQSGALNHDIKVITVSGTLTVNGKAMADDTVLDNRPRGYLRFIDSVTNDTTSVSLGETGAASYSALLYAGSYDVQLYSPGEDDQDVLPRAATTELLAQKSLMQSGALNHDVKVITVSGAVTVNGKPMSDDTVLDNRPRGYLRFIDDVTADKTSVSLGETGPASYSVQLYSGSYEVRLYSPGEDDQDVLPRAAETSLRAQIALTQDGALSHDVKVVTVSGTVTVNGKPMADDTVLDNRPRGYLRFIDTITADTTSVSVGETGPANYSLTLYAGSYDVSFSSPGADDQDVLPPDGLTQLKIGCP